ncbi:phytanoyl-CoA dioxygenase family protein [Chitinophaga sp. GCM10012297]|uniref:Phytanoyl-CoA dioxygenase family protein n=1 Tax=Chitinophaga chungangae TaxID=2821488 RepID=A0ABS3YK17_9BACT|nr:phytanoyl-CoA dioxygenase family protein [Chitinophaga chungangae]MBO9155002.1 phytanoyl-CoA dioxygenase family protein [Chitinophaga chungangae]
MENFQLNANQIGEYHQNGYVIVRNFLREAEVKKLQDIAFADGLMRRHAFDLNDQTGKKTKLTLWYSPGNDAYGLLTKSKRMVQSAAALMDGDSAVCHFHSKLMQKEPRVGGAWEWHQDYGYWYKNEFLFPDQMTSIMIAITDANIENGCLQVIKGSHKMGRIEHGFAGEQVGASGHYVELALKTMELLYVELKAGDCLIFHPNLLHRSEANLSENPRWSLISVYNRAANVPYNEPSQSSTVPVQMVPDEALLDWAAEEISESAAFLEKDKDEALK